MGKIILRYGYYIKSQIKHFQLIPVCRIAIVVTLALLTVNLQIGPYFVEVRKCQDVQSEDVQFKRVQIWYEHNKQKKHVLNNCTTHLYFFCNKRHKIFRGTRRNKEKVTRKFEYRS